MGFGVYDVRENNLFGWDDSALLQLANSQSRAVVTHDGDFGTLTVARLEPFVGIVYLRPGHIDPQFTIESLRLLVAGPGTRAAIHRRRETDRQFGHNSRAEPVASGLHRVKRLLPPAENDILARSVFPLSETRNETSPVVEGGFGRGRGAIDLSLALGGRRCNRKSREFSTSPAARASFTPSLTAMAAR